MTTKNETGVRYQMSVVYPEHIMLYLKQMMEDKISPHLETAATFLEMYGKHKGIHPDYGKPIGCFLCSEPIKNREPFPGFISPDCEAIVTLVPKPPHQDKKAFAMPVCPHCVETAIDEIDLFDKAQAMVEKMADPVQHIVGHQ